MAQTLPRDAAEERLRWIQPYLERKRSLKDLAELSPFDYRTLKRWVKAYKEKGLEGLIPQSRRPHFHPRQYSAEFIEHVRQLRQKTDLGPDILEILLKREGIQASHSGLGKLLKREGLSRRKRMLQKKERWVPRSTVPGEVVEIDVAYARKFKGDWLYQFTAVDSCTRWRHLRVNPEQNNGTAIKFLEQLVAAAPFKIQGVKTDNGSIFTNRYTGYAKSTDPLNPKLHAFDKKCQSLGIIHYLIDPGKPQQQGKVERSHRTDRERFWRKVEFKTLPELRQKQKEYLSWYNTECPHLGIKGLTPQEKLESLQGTNVRV